MSDLARPGLIIQLSGQNVGGLDEYRRKTLTRLLVRLLTEENEMDGDLPCGCFAQEGRLCREAREMWDQVQSAYWQAQRTGLREAQDEYARLHTEYLNHFREQRVEKDSEADSIERNIRLFNQEMTAKGF